MNFWAFDIFLSSQLVKRAFNQPGAAWCFAKMLAFHLRLPGGDRVWLSC
jgi:hypothetical protein